MTDQFEDLGEALSPTLDLPVAGKVYRVPSPPARVGLRLQAAFAISAARQAGTAPKAHHVELIEQDDGSTSLDQDALGPVYDEMIADGVNTETLSHAGMTAWWWIVAGRRAARLYWVSPLGEAQRPLPDLSTSTSMDAATTTPTPASTSGTTSPTGSSPGSSSTPTA
jgi:hypothetical protein